MRILITFAATLAVSAFLFGQEPPKQIKKVDIGYTQPSSGAAMFKDYCAACHGADGTGNGPAASALKKAPANLTLLSKKNNGKFPALEVQNFIRGDAQSVAAHGTRDMPMWGDIFHSVSAGDSVVTLRVANLTDYIKGLQAN
ncbi:MAG: c-type cytochrome [Bryobacteraceae bacterium]|jgi:mono/diheme cytochrome c family protein